MTNVRENVQVVVSGGAVPVLSGAVRRPPPPPRPPGPTTERVHPAALAVALALAGGDHGRLRFDPDGTVVVANTRRK